MASLFKGGGLALALIILIIVISSSIQTISVADARSPHGLARQLAKNCDSPEQLGCGGGGGGGGGGGSSGSPRPGRPSPQTPGSSRCRKGCCKIYKMGACDCCK